MIALRKIDENDLDRLVELLQDPTVSEMTTVPFPYDRSHAESFYKNVVLARESENIGITRAICTDTDPTLIGTIGYTKKKPDAHKVSVGYWIGKDYRNRGYTTDAVKQLIEIIKTNPEIVRIEAYHNVNNPASGRVMEKAGMEFEGTLKAFAKKQDAFTDQNIYSYIVKPNT